MPLFEVLGEYPIQRAVTRAMQNRYTQIGFKQDKMLAAVYAWQQGAHISLWGLSERAEKLNLLTIVYSYPNTELTSGRLRKHAVVHLID